MVSRDRIEDWFYLGVFLIAMLFAFIALIKLYLSLDELIRIWLNYKYQPLFRMLFSLSVLAVSLYFIRERLIKSSQS